MVNTNDAGPGSLRQAILDSNASTEPTGDINFAIPASAAAYLDVPVPGFDPVTQTWRIQLQSPLPPITHPVTIDGYTQGQYPIPYRYPSAMSLAIQSLTVLGSPTGGSFTLTTSFPLPVGTTQAIPFNSNAGTIQAALEAIIGAGNVTVAGGPAPDQPFTITFGGAYARQILLPLTWHSDLTGGTNPGLNVTTVSVGGTPVGDPVSITSTPNSIDAIQGNNAHLTIIVDGSGAGGGTGFEIDTSHSTVRGMVITGFDVGVSVPSPASPGNPTPNDPHLGNRIQGNFIGGYLLYQYDPNTGAKLAAPGNVRLVTAGNAQAGVLLESRNQVVGGSNPQENNVITGNGTQGVLIRDRATGNVIEGNQIGLASTDSGRYYQNGNGAEGILIEGDASSNLIGGPVAGAGNLISANLSHGIRISGGSATRNVLAANIIGLGPGGGYLFGTGNPGNGDYGDGVRIDGSTSNQIGGPTSDWGNTISSNFGAGIYITGAGAIGNSISNNLIGLTADGKAAKGNAREGVAVFAPRTTVGPGNVISGNLRGVLISGPSATGVVVEGNLIGTDGTGKLDLGNSFEGVRIENAATAVIGGTSFGAQVISGNDVGVAIVGASATRNLVTGNFIGTDQSGKNPLPNAHEGIVVESAGNTIGGTSAASRNLISANETGVRISGAGATSNVVQGNLIGTDISGLLPLGNEVRAVVINLGASANLIGGSSAATGNVIAFNEGPGVTVDAGVFNSILTNSIFSNTDVGIRLINGGNHNQPAPMLTAIHVLSTGTSVQGVVQGTPSTPYTIQFFSNPGTAREGRTYLGQVSVVTDGSGNAAFSASLSAALDPSQPYVTATATSASGDTSEFSTNGTATSLAVSFSMASYTVSQSAGTATITVIRSYGGVAGTVSYATTDGTAHAGIDYVPATGVLSFGPGETQKTFTISIINTQQVGGSRSLSLTLTNPSTGMELGSPSQATLTILGYTTPGPTVQAVVPVLSGNAITSVMIRFSEPLDPARAVNLLNYGYSLQAAGNDQRFGTPDDLLFGIATATYNSSNNTVVLWMGNPVFCNSFIRLTINQSTDNAAVPVGVADTSGNLLDGNDDGRPGGVFTATFARGQQLTYPDNQGNAVTLKLSGGGTMVLTRRADGSAWQLDLLGARPGRTKLTGQVRKSLPGATGRTTIGSIAGASLARVRLPYPAFAVGRLATPLAAKATSGGDVATTQAGRSVPSSGQALQLARRGLSRVQGHR